MSIAFDWQWQSTTKNPHRRSLMLRPVGPGRGGPPRPHGATAAAAWFPQAPVCLRPPSTRRTHLPSAMISLHLCCPEPVTVQLRQRIGIDLAGLNHIRPGKLQFIPSKNPTYHLTQLRHSDEVIHSSDTAHATSCILTHTRLTNRFGLAFRFENALIACLLP